MKNMHVLLRHKGKRLKVGSGWEINLNHLVIFKNYNENWG